MTQLADQTSATAAHYLRLSAIEQRRAVVG